MGRCTFECLRGRQIATVFAALCIDVIIRGQYIVEAQPSALGPDAFETPPNSNIPSFLPPGFPPSPPESSNVTSAILSRLNNAANSITKSIAENFSFCISDIESDLRKTFDFKHSSDILLKCAMDVGPDFVGRVCGQGEIELYFGDLKHARSSGIPSNINCSPRRRPQACQSGWSGLLSDINANLDTATVPARTADPQACCAGFFCPPGLTCMIPCPLGAYCPRATYNAELGTCEPYGYGAPAGDPDTVQCGGADLWLTWNDASGTFCGRSNGTFCRNAITQEICDKGHFCRAGSTRPSKCSFLTKCNRKGVQDEDVATSGILVIVIVFIVLLLFYNSFDQLMHIRARRKSKLRDKAAREARESVSAVQRWKKAKEAAKLAGIRVSKFPSHLSSTLSRSKSKFTTDIRTVPRSGGTDAVVNDGALYDESQCDKGHTIDCSWHLRDEKLDFEAQGDGREPQLVTTDPPPTFVHRPTWSHDLYPVDRPIHYDLYENVQVPPVSANATGEESPLTEEKLARKSRPSTLALTHSQVYKYAYGQIEKEKVTDMAKPMSVADLVDSVGFREMLEFKGRRQMEIAFVDLSLILKATGQRILSNVTGKFSPSRITAVMGPSGAGKTTFLNALAGKETGSLITGQVFINGSPGSMQSYKRIIGFVPQDDIVHGSLTVEENLVFSAKYRLPVNMPRQDRVLAVERILDSLGLTGLRDSLVGTVEKRGISGGQRKRVNVGMELVIEPSLIILDEPTSGLDSTSSRLVMRSLRREAALGVNVLVVLHQPSYALFNMFDDVTLLAKGGYAVYLGPLNELESYFSSLGFDVPDRTNPPDYFLDVLEGLAAPENDPSFDISALPLLWMCHNGYHIPLHLQESADYSTSERNIPSVVFHGTSKSFVEEAWDELRVYLLVKWDSLKTSFASVKDLSERKTPGFFYQYRLILERVFKQKFRESRLIAQDYIILLLAGICVGVLSGWKDTNLGGTAYIYTIIAVALLVMIASLRTFSADKLQFWRESSSGINRLAFFLAKDTVDHFNSFVKPLVYLSMFYFFSNPRATFASNYIITLALVYCCTGMGYVLAVTLTPQPAQLTSVFIPVVATLLVSDPRTGFLGQVSKLSYGYWALQAYTIANVERYSGVWIITRCAALARFSFRLDNYYLCLRVLFGYGTAARVIAYFCLLVFHRKRQK